MFISPLDQFRILVFFPISFGSLDFSISNFLLIMCIALGSFLFLGFLTVSPGLYISDDIDIFLVSNNRWSLVIESLYQTLSNLLLDNVGLKGEVYFPFLYVVFVFVLQSNLIGLIPYSFTTTSHIILTFSLALIVFIGVNVVGVDIHGKRFLNLFLPSGTALPLAFLLVPLEIVSFLSKPISLSVRLFANMMAGHTLLKVIAGFAWSMMKAGGFLFVAHILPMIVLFLLVGLELGVAVIQAYVFSVLSCIYLNDSINLH